MDKCKKELVAKQEKKVEMMSQIEELKKIQNDL